MINKPKCPSLLTRDESKGCRLWLGIGRKELLDWQLVAARCAVLGHGRPKV
jgi:hypothetical protein